MLIELRSSGIQAADQASVAQELGDDPARAAAAPKQALQRKLLDGLRNLLKEELKLNQPEASDGWPTQDALWLVSKAISDKLRAHLLSHGIEGIPIGNTTVCDALQDLGIALSAPGSSNVTPRRISRLHVSPRTHNSTAGNRCKNASSNCGCIANNPVV